MKERKAKQRDVQIQTIHIEHDNASRDKKDARKTRKQNGACGSKQVGVDVCNRLVELIRDWMRSCNDGKCMYGCGSGQRKGNGE